MVLECCCLASRPGGHSEPDPKKGVLRLGMQVLKVEVPRRRADSWLYSLAQSAHCWGSSDVWSRQRGVQLTWLLMWKSRQYSWLAYRSFSRWRHFSWTVLRCIDKAKAISENVSNIIRLSFCWRFFWSVSVHWLPLFEQTLTTTL